VERGGSPNPLFEVGTTVFRISSEGKDCASFYLFDYSEILVNMDVYKPIFPTQKNVAGRYFIEALFRLPAPVPSVVSHSIVQ
jgi:hypothetical protein